MTGSTAQEVFGLRFDRLSPAGRAALAMALAALWLLGRRYGGITQDASLYLLQGLRRLDPATFSKDLFFAYGSQDTYTLFAHLYAPLIELFGAGAAALLVTVVGQCAFVVASLLLIFRVATGPARWWSLALVAVVSGYYGGIGVHRLAEPFATARSLAEPLVLAALGCTLAGRHRTAFGALAAAMLLHPLVAAPGMGAVLLWHASGRARQRWLVPLLVAVAAVFGLTWIAFTPSYDPAWRAVVLERSPQIFVSQWPLPDWSRLLWGLCVTWIAIRFVDAPVRRLGLAVAAVCLAGIGASWIAVDLLDNASLSAIQLWRAHWLLQFLAIVLVPVAVACLWQPGLGARTAAACLAASCCFGRAELPVAAVLAVLAVALEFSERRRPGWMREGLHRWTLLAIVCLASVGLLFELQSRMPSAYGAVQAARWIDYVGTAATVGGLIPLAALLWSAAYSRLPAAALVAAAVTLAVSIAAWDARGPWPRFVEQASAAANPFRDVLPPDAVVYWPGPHGKPWVVLGRPNWFSADQGAGVVFNRGTAIEYADRARASRDLQSAMDNCSWIAQPACRIDARPVRELCERRGGPDYLVLNARVDGLSSIEWQLPAYIGPGRQSLFLFDCRVIPGIEKGRR